MGLYYGNRRADSAAGSGKSYVLSSANMLAVLARLCDLTHTRLIPTSSSPNQAGYVDTGVELHQPLIYI